MNPILFINTFILFFAFTIEGTVIALCIFLASLINVVTEISSSDSNNAIADLAQWHHGKGFPKYKRYLLIELFVVAVAVLVVVTVVVVDVASKTSLVGISALSWCNTVSDIRTLQNCVTFATKLGVQTVLWSTGGMCSEKWNGRRCNCCARWKWTVCCMGVD